MWTYGYFICDREIAGIRKDKQHFKKILFWSVYNTTQKGKV